MAMIDRRSFLKAAALTATAGCLSGSVLGSDARKKRPNFLVIMADDMGFSDLGCCGGEIDTPHLDRLAQNGIRFTQFYNCARCCPTRASLITGLYPHQAGVGHMVNKGPTPAYLGHLNDRCVTIAEVLRQTGYRTYMSGKAHWGEQEFAWPINRGFDHHYGLVSGAMNYFDITKRKQPGIDRIFVRDRQRITPGGNGFYATTAFTDEAIGYLEHHEEQYKDRPFFLYLTYNAPHWPLHALPEDIAKYRGRYKSGWDEIRRQRQRRQTQTNLFGKEIPLSPRDPGAADWDSLSEEQKDRMDHKMAIYAAQVHRMDREIGRVIDTLRRQGQLENTLILFLSDNGACAETGPLGQDWRKGKGGPLGTVDSYESYGQSWANASNTPFSKFKAWTHEGGCVTPLVAHWPEGIERPGTTTDEVGHIVDIMATCCDLAGADYPSEYNGKEIIPMQGISLTPLFTGRPRRQHDYLFWEHEGKRALRQGRYKVVYTPDTGWELFDMEADRIEQHNLSEINPEKCEALKRIWYGWADQWQVVYSDKS